MSEWNEALEAECAKLIRIAGKLDDGQADPFVAAEALRTVVTSLRALKRPETALERMDRSGADPWSKP